MVSLKSNYISIWKVNKYYNLKNETIILNIGIKYCYFNKFKLNIICKYNFFIILKIMLLNMKIRVYCYCIPTYLVCYVFIIYTTVLNTLFI